MSETIRIRGQALTPVPALFCGERELPGERLRRLRVGRGLSQRRVATIVGVSNVSVSQWEAGLCLPGTANLIALAHRALGVSIDYLLTGRERG